MMGKLGGGDVARQTVLTGRVEGRSRCVAEMQKEAARYRKRTEPPVWCWTPRTATKPAQAATRLDRPHEESGGLADDKPSKSPPEHL